MKPTQEAPGAPSRVEKELSEALIPLQSGLMKPQLVSEVKGQEVTEEDGHRKCQRKCQVAGPGDVCWGRALAHVRV